MLEFARAHAALCRCNLRAAAEVDAAVYNEVGQLMQARATGAAAGQPQPDPVENRRRPRHLAPRPAEPFYYLKR